MLFITTLKQQLNKPITLLLMILVCLLLTLNMTEVERSRENRSFVGHDTNNYVSLRFDLKNNFLRNVNNAERFETAMASYGLFDKTGFDLVNAVLEDDTYETLKKNIFFNLIWLKSNRMSDIEIDNMMLRNDLYDMWQVVSDGIDYDSVDFRPDTHLSGIEDQLLLETRYLMTLLINGIEPTYDDEANNVTVLYSFIYTTGPILFILIPLLVAYNSVNKDLNNGVLKLLLTQSISRKRYYISKWLVSSIQSLIIVVVPALIMSIFYGLKNGFVSMIYPVTYLSKVWTRLKPIPNFIEVIFTDGSQTTLGRSAFLHMAPSNAYENVYYQPYEGVDLIPFWQYALIGLLILVLYVCFITALVQLISALFNNGAVSLAVSFVVIGGCMGLTHFMTIGEHYNIIPLNFFRIGRIIEGTQNVTVLVAVLILILSAGILLLGGFKYFERKVI